MAERNHLTNGRFLHDLDGWTVSGAEYSAGDGDEHYGVAVLEQDEYLEQDFSVPYARTYTLHLALKSTGAIGAGDVTVLITDGDGNTVATLQPTGSADAWFEYESEIGLGSGTTYNIKITNTQAEDVKADDVWLWYVPFSRSEIAERVHSKLGRLASERELSTALDGSKTEGDYTYAVDSGLRQVGAVNPETDLPDVRYLDANLIDTTMDMIEREMLDRLENDYITKVDLKVGPHSENFSQIAKSIRERAGKGESKSGQVIVRRLTHG